LIGRTTIILSAVLGLTGCAVATGSRDWGANRQLLQGCID